MSKPGGKFISFILGFAWLLGQAGLLRSWVVPRLDGTEHAEERPPAAQPYAVKIVVYSLGEATQVSTPIRVGLEFNTHIEGPFRLELLGQDGRMLFRQVWAAPVKDENPALQRLPVNFEIPAAQEPGRLVFSVLDQNGRLQAVDSLDLVLQATQVETRLAALRNPVSLEIQTPNPGTRVSGGTVLVSGSLQANSELPLKVVLVAEDGKVVGQRVAAVQSSNVNGGTWQYSADVPYQVLEMTPVRIQVIQSGEPVSRVKLLASVLVDLTP